jgi:hypothetical protein
VLVGLLAWPWNLALSASESARQASRPNHGSWSARGGRTRQINRFARCGLVTCAALEADDYDESEEGDVAGPDRAAAPSPAPGDPGGCAAVPDRAAEPPWPGRSLRFTLLCRLRC